MSSESDLETIPDIDDALLSVRDVESGYGDLQVLNGVDLDVRDNEIVLLFGPNGAGKSTCMRAIYGLLDLWAGRVTIRGSDVSDVPAEQMIGQGMNYVPQRGNVFGNLTVDENLEIGSIHAENPSERKRELYDLFPILDERRKQKAETMSGGEQQQLAMARGLMTDPDLLLVDEPSAGLSPQATENVFEHVRRINSEGTAVLMIEQRVKEGLQVADRGYVLDMGETRFEGPSQALAEAEIIRDLYLRR